MFNRKRADVGNGIIGRARKNRKQTISTINIETRAKTLVNEILDDRGIVLYDKETQSMMSNGKYLTRFNSLHPIAFTIYAHDFGFSEDDKHTVVHYDSNINVYEIQPNKTCSFFQSIFRGNNLVEANILVRSKIKKDNYFTFSIIIPYDSVIRSQKNNSDYVQSQIIELTPRLEFANGFSILPFSFNINDNHRINKRHITARFELTSTEPFELHSATTVQFNDVNIYLNRDNAYSSLNSKIDILRNSVRNVESVISQTFN